MTKTVSGSPHLITTAPSLTVCRWCNRPVLAATISGVDRYVDTATLNDTGELAALVEGRSTFTLVAEDYLVRRTVHAIAAGAPRKPVLAEHACKEIPDHHIEHAWMEYAKALVFSALGATMPPERYASPPY